MEEYYQEKIDLLKDLDNDYEGMIYIFYKRDRNGKFLPRYFGLTRKFGKEIICTSCGLKSNAYYFNPKDSKNQEKPNEKDLVCPRCKIAKNCSR